MVLFLFIKKTMIKLTLSVKKYPHITYRSLLHNKKTANQLSKYLIYFYIYLI